MGGARTEFLMFINVNLSRHKGPVATVLDRAGDVCGQADLLRCAFPKATPLELALGQGFGEQGQNSLFPRAVCGFINCLHDCFGKGTRSLNPELGALNSKPFIRLKFMWCEIC